MCPNGVFPDDEAGRLGRGCAGRPSRGCAGRRADRKIYRKILRNIEDKLVIRR